MSRCRLVSSEPASGGFTRWKHVVPHCIRIEDGYTYGELADRVALISDVCDALNLESDDLSKPSTLCKSFDRFKMWVCQQLLRRSAAATAYLRSRCHRWDVLRAIPALFLLLSPSRSDDYHNEDDGLYELPQQDSPRCTVLCQMEV